MNTKIGCAGRIPEKLEAGRCVIAGIEAIAAAALLVLMFSPAASAQQPVISGFLVNGVSSNTGPVLASLTILGSGFGNSQGNNTVSIGGLAMVGAGLEATTWTSTAITAQIPQDAATGGVVVGVWPASGAIVYSDPVTFYIGPLITGLSATSGLVGTPIIISGSGFGTTQGAVYFNGVSASNTWTAESITATVPSGATEGPVTVSAGSPAQVSNPSQIFTPTPSINSLSTYSGVGGTVVTISGNSFGLSQSAGNGTVTFDGVSAAISSGKWSNASITVTVPSTGTTGDVVVTVNGVPSAGVMFTYTPLITSLSPTPILADGTATIGGTNFGAPLPTDMVTFNGISAVISNWTNNSIQAGVPSSITGSGTVVVSVNSVASKPYAFSLESAYNYSVTYAPDSDVLTVNDAVNGNWVYAYDGFNRLTCSNLSSNGSCATPTDGTATYTYAYDRYGNRWQQNGPYTMLLTFTTNNGNQMDGYSYDAAGNLLNDGNHSYTYDAENRIIQVDNGETAVYVYDADGQRVQKTTGSLVAQYLLDLNGNTVTELSSSGVWTRGEVYADGRHLATYGDGSSGTTYFIETDWLGTERARVLPNGDVAETCTSLPFGDGQSCTGVADPSPDHFTGKQRDTESNNDYFGGRYMGSSMARFLSPDYSSNSVIMDLPQSWNKYTYVVNRPTFANDPDGRCPWCIGAVVGAVVEGGFDLGKQLYDNGGSLSKVSWGEVGANAVGGAVAGALAVATGGASLVENAVVGDIVAGGTSNVVGGIVTRALDPNTKGEDVLSAGEISKDAVTGFISGGVGHIAGDSIHLPDDPSVNGAVSAQRRLPARTPDGRFASYDRLLRNQITRAGVVGSATTHTASWGWNQLFLMKQPCFIVSWDDGLGNSGSSGCQ
jgi:RHS repeat-associated protein